MRLNFKRFFAAVMSFCMIYSCFGSVNVFAKETDIVHFDENCDASTVNSVPDGEAVVSVVPSKDSLSVGDEFYVDIILENNPGFAAYGFTIDYDPSVIIPVKGVSTEMNEVTQVSYNGGIPAISASQVNSGIDVGASSGKFFRTNLILGDDGILEAEGNGILFRVNFKAVGEGTSYINYSEFQTVVLANKDMKRFDVYVKNAEVSVSGGNSVSDGSENTTVVNDNNSNDNNSNDDNTSDDNLKGENSADSDNKTEDITESTTSADIKTNDNKTENGDGFTVNLPTNKSAPKNFNDLASVSWAENSIINLSSLGIVNGVSDTAFNPKAYTYRADFVVVISGLLGLSGQGENLFSDVDSSSYYEGAVSLANKFGIVQGSNGMFMPKNNITRQDAMVILSRVLEKSGKLKKADTSVLNAFNDKDGISPYAVSSMADLVGMGILNGDNNGNLNPKGFINRAEMAVVIDKIYDVLK